jgi:hypothetical protein
LSAKSLPKEPIVGRHSRCEPPLVLALLVDSESAKGRHAAEGMSEALGPWSISLSGECKAMHQRCVLRSQSLP